MVLSLLLIGKIILFMILTDIKYNKLLIFFVSALYVAFFYTLIYLSNNKKRQTIAFTIYNIASAFMFADSLYYHYFHYLPSIKMVKMLGMVTVVDESVKAIINPLNILFLIDIPFLCVYSSKKKKKIKASESNTPKKMRYGVPSIIAGVLAVVLIICGTTGYGSVLTKQELFTYHFTDLGSLFAGGEEKVEGESNFTEEDILGLRDGAKGKGEEMKGIGKGRNLIVIQVEGFQNFALNLNYEGQEITPYLNEFLKDDGSIYFDRYFQLLGRGNTSDAEFVTNNSLYPCMENPSYDVYRDNTFYGLPWIMRDEGYSSWVFHGYKKEFYNRDKAYPNQGFEKFISEEDYDVHETVGFGITDKDFFSQTIDYIKDMEKPFYSFIITLTSHTPFNMPEKYMDIKLRPEHKDTMFGNYLNSIHYLDAAIGEFIEDLKKEGLYEDSVICIYGDHFALSSADKGNEKVMSEYFNKPYDFDDMMNIPLIIHIPGEKVNRTVDRVGSQLDFLPTILNIMGIENDKGIMFGQDLLNSKEGFVAQQTYMLKGSFIDDEKIFEISRDGIYDHSRAWRLFTKKPVDIKKCKKQYERAIDEIDKCNFIMENNLLKDIIEGKSIDISK